jgi:hypothetical protein
MASSDYSICIATEAITVISTYSLLSLSNFESYTPLTSTTTLFTYDTTTITLVSSDMLSTSTDSVCTSAISIPTAPGARSYDCSTNSDLIISIDPFTVIPTNMVSYSSYG